MPKYMDNASEFIFFFIFAGPEKVVDFPFPRTLRIESALLLIFLFLIHELKTVR